MRVPSTDIHIHIHNHNHIHNHMRESVPATKNPPSSRRVRLTAETETRVLEPAIPAYSPPPVRTAKLPLA